MFAGLSGPLCNKTTCCRGYRDDARVLSTRILSVSLSLSLFMSQAPTDER